MSTPYPPSFPLPTDPVPGPAGSNDFDRPDHAPGSGFTGPDGTSEVEGPSGFPPTGFDGGTNP